MARVQARTEITDSTTWVVKTLVEIVGDIDAIKQRIITIEV